MRQDYETNFRFCYTHKDIQLMVFNNHKGASNMRSLKKSKQTHNYTMTL